ncbi:cation/H(+) antiporter 3-like [Dorcoceras hygrometricum]|uniref:Cation/H(+) antiporter 3-like n=1 Tax=Dorcoceras hygrometricum TaxID=472368 RepID=A0A2Z7C8R5_9LAMI|nr:cation/H(+) antiporter 3-like [Dorcoceras hygrometricum]
MDYNSTKGIPSNSKNDLCATELALHSPGAWGTSIAQLFHEYAFPRLQLQLAIIFLVTQSLHLLLRRFNLPRIVSEIMAGIILGPTILGQLGNIQTDLFPREGELFLDLLSKIGYIFFIFLSGVKMDPRTVLRTGLKAWTIAVITVAAPTIAGIIVRIRLRRFVHRYRLPAFVNIWALQNLFPFPVVASMLVDLKIMNSELGRLALASALICDLMSNFVGTVVSSGRIGQMADYTIGVIVQASVLGVCLILLIVFLGRPICLWIIQKTPEGKSVSRVNVILIALLVLIVVLLCDNTGFNYQYGPFLLGLVVPDGPPLGSTLVDRLETLVSGLLAPLLITYCGMKVNLIELFDLNFISFLLFILICCLGMKLVAVFFPAVICRVPIKDAVALSFILSAQGVVQMSFYYSYAVNQTFDGETFSILTTWVLLQAGIGNLVVKSLYDYSRMYTGYQKRDIQHTSANSELRVLTCAHRIDDVFAVKKVLEASFPTAESPIAVYALHLIELAGRAHPLLIDHQLGQKSSGGTRTQKMIEAFYSFEQQYSGLATVQQFTAMSLTKFMHHDICTLAFNKLASLIILPFHRKWNYQGKMILDSSSLRAINLDVLELAPCSVGIFVDRHKVRRSSAPSSTYNVGVAFFGGTDDREALAYARRMALSPGLHLMVIRFVPWDMYTGDNQWDAVLDAEILKDTRMHGARQDNIVYREERVKDGAETALLIHAMEEAFDLIIVGRRHRDDTPQLLGLSEWNDLPELGPVGDMLAAADISKPVSVMVIQHQNVKSK